MSQVCEAVAKKIRKKIIGGEWKPGSRLPTRTKLISSIGSNHYTVQSAIKQLELEGYIEVGARKSGTRVVENPPHLSRYYLILQETPDHWDHFGHALEEAAEQKSSETCEITCFYGFGGHRNINEFEQVINDVKNKSVAGLIFASSAQEFIGSPLLEVPGIPRVAISNPLDFQWGPKVHFDYVGFINKAVAHMVKQGRKKLALLCPYYNLFTDTFKNALADHGLVCESSWMQFPDREKEYGAKHAVDLLMHPGQSNRPDGLIIADDNLIEGSVKSLISNNIKVPDELSIVTMNNFPHKVQTELDVTRIGFNIPAMLDVLMTRIEELSSDISPEENTSIPAIMEDEFKKAEKGDI